MKLGRLLLVTPYFSSHGGGIEGVAGQLVQHLHLQNKELHIEWMASDCDDNPPPIPGVRFLRAKSSNAIEIKTGLPVPLWSFGAMGRLWRAIKRCDVVHFHDVAYSCSVLCALFCVVQRKPYFVTQHTGFVDHPVRWMRVLRDWINRVPGRWMLERARAVAFISDAVRRDFAAMLPSQMLVLIPNGVATGVFHDVDDAQRARERNALCDELGLNATRPLVLFVGRFVTMKGVLIVGELSRRFPGCNFIFAGSGPLDPQSSLGENARVVRGRRGKSLATVYRAADLLLLPSYSEGFPLVVQESLACGTPVLIERKIGDASPRAREWMNFESLEGNEDDIERWTRKLRAMLDELELNRETETASRHERAKWAKREWNWNGCARAYLELFDQELQGRDR